MHHTRSLWRSGSTFIEFVTCLLLSYLQTLALDTECAVSVCRLSAWCCAGCGALPARSGLRRHATCTILHTPARSIRYSGTRIDTLCQLVVFSLVVQGWSRRDVLPSHKTGPRQGHQMYRFAYHLISLHPPCASRVAWSKRFVEC